MIDWSRWFGRRRFARAPGSPASSTQPPLPAAPGEAAARDKPAVGNSRLLLVIALQAALIPTARNVRDPPGGTSLWMFSAVPAELPSDRVARNTSSAWMAMLLVFTNVPAMWQQHTFSAPTRPATVGCRLTF